MSFGKALSKKPLTLVMQLKGLCFYFAIFLFPLFAYTQINQKGNPLSLSEKFLEQYSDKTIPRINIPLYDRNKFEALQKRYADFAIEAIGGNTKITLQNSGEWMILNNGDRLWRLEIRAKGTESLTLLYDDFWLPKGAKFFLYTADEAQILGAFTHENNKVSGRFSTATTKGEAIFLEYYEPAKVSTFGRISINKVLQKPRRGRSGDEFGFNTSSDCHININCEQGNDFQEVKRGVVRIVMFLEGAEGTFLGYCSGALLNNTAQDQTPYLLSAFHCLVPDFTPLFDQWQFNFGYEVPNCNNSMTEPIPKTIVGCEMIASRENTDFLLLKISSAIPSSFNPYFCGWNRSEETTPIKGVMIHHPCGDTKKISVDNQSTATIHDKTINWAEYTSSPNSHLRIAFDEGFSQIGASGSPLFDEDGLIYGQLHGGNINESQCEVARLFYGRLARSWDGDKADIRLKEWLDPLGLEPTTLTGFDPFQNLANFIGLVQTPAGEGIAEVEVDFSSEDTSVVITSDENGQFQLQLPRNIDYTIAFSKNIAPFNGVSTLDMVKIQQHILGLESFDDTFKPLAADVNLSNTITTFDLVEIRRLILGISKEFPTGLSWGFVSPEGNLFNILTLNNVNPQVNLTIIGIKMGDVNYSADPKK